MTIRVYNIVSTKKVIKQLNFIYKSILSFSFFDKIAKYKRVYVYTPLMNRNQTKGYRRKGQSLQHRRAFLEYLDELEKDGWKVIDLQNKSPDGIALKDNKIVAVEIILSSQTGKYTSKTKKKEYSMFDDVLVRIVKREPDQYDRYGWRM